MEAPKSETIREHADTFVKLYKSDSKPAAHRERQGRSTRCRAAGCGSIVFGAQATCKRQGGEIQKP